MSNILGRVQDEGEESGVLLSPGGTGRSVRQKGSSPFYRSVFNDPFLFHVTGDRIYIPV